jgi:hypothetical protein
MKEIPLIETHLTSQSEFPILNLHPSPAMLDKAVTEILINWKWKSFVILFESPAW